MAKNNYVIDVATDDAVVAEQGVLTFAFAGMEPEGVGDYPKDSGVSFTTKEGRAGAGAGEIDVFADDLNVAIKLRELLGTGYVEDGTDTDQIVYKFRGVDPGYLPRIEAMGLDAEVRDSKGRFLLPKEAAHA
jgi:hypothetical protein